MIKDKLIIIPYNLPQNWACDYIEQTVKILSLNNYVVAFLWNDALSLWEIVWKKIKYHQNFKLYKKIGRQIIFRPIHFLPFRRFNLIQKINLFLNLKLLEYKLNCVFPSIKRILWIFHPALGNLVVSFFNAQIIIYDCVDYHWSPDSFENKALRKEEQEIIKKVDYFFVNSPALFRLKKKLSPKIVQVPQGCNTNLFLKIKKMFLPDKISALPQPRIGFIGNIDYRLDFKLIINLAKNNPLWSFIFIGPMWLDKKQSPFIKTRQWLNLLKQESNIYLLEKVDKHQIISIIDSFDFCFIPYNIRLDFCRFSYPMKVFEYFCRGKPVISTPIESLLSLDPYVQIANNAKEFTEKIKVILKNGWPQEYTKKQKQLAIANSWQAKIEKISKIIQYRSIFRYQKLFGALYP